LISITFHRIAAVEVFEDGFDAGRAAWLNTALSVRAAPFTAAQPDYSNLGLPGRPQRGVRRHKSRIRAPANG
jgi:hypothetical protein